MTSWPSRSSEGTRNVRRSLRRWCRGGSPRRCERPPTCWSCRIRGYSLSWRLNRQRWRGRLCPTSRAACGIGVSARRGGCCPICTWASCRFDRRRPCTGLLRVQSVMTTRVGVSPVYTGLEKTPQAMHLARIAMTSIPRGETRLCVFDDAPVPALIESSPTTSYRVMSNVLGPVLETAEEERDVLIETLETYSLRAQWPKPASAFTVIGTRCATGFPASNSSPAGPSTTRWARSSFTSPSRPCATCPSPPSSQPCRVCSVARQVRLFGANRCCAKANNAWGEELRCGSGCERRYPTAVFAAVAPDMPWAPGPGGVAVEQMYMPGTPMW
jgi:hypothetical protein